MFIFIDESGDLGFDFERGGKPSDFFLVGAIKINDEKYLNRVIKRHRKRLKKKMEEKREIKFSNTSPENRKRILEDINKLDLEIFIVYINKHNAYSRVKDSNPMRMYSYLLKILTEKCLSEGINEDVVIIFDRCFTKVQQEALELYLRIHNENLLKTEYNIKMLHLQSQEGIGLLCADFVCGAAMHKITGRTEIYYSIIQDKVKCMKPIY